MQLQWKQAFYIIFFFFLLTLLWGPTTWWHLRNLSHLYWIRDKIMIMKQLHSRQPRRQKERSSTICRLLFDDHYNLAGLGHLSLGLLVQREGLEAWEWVRFVCSEGWFCWLNCNRAWSLAWWLSVLGSKQWVCQCLVIVHFYGERVQNIQTDEGW